MIHVTTSLIRAQFVSYKLKIFYCSIIILNLKVVIPIKFIPFVIIIIVYLVIVSLTKYIFYKFMIKPCEARAFH